MALLSRVESSFVTFHFRNSNPVMKKKKEKKKQAEEEAVEVATLAPQGAFPLFITAKSIEKYSLSVNAVLVEFKHFKRDLILEDINRVGVLCDFHEIKSSLLKYNREEFLVVQDKFEKYGKNFIAVLFEPALSLFSDSIASAQKKQKEDEIALEQKVQEEKLRVERERKEWEVKNTYQEKPIVATCNFESSTSEATVKEILSTKVLSKRSFLSIQIRATEDKLGRITGFSDRWADECAYMEWRHYKDSNFELRPLVRDVGLQIGASWTHTFLTGSNVKGVLEESELLYGGELLSCNREVQCGPDLTFAKMIEYNLLLLTSQEQNEMLSNDKRIEELLSKKFRIVEAFLKENLIFNPYLDFISSEYPKYADFIKPQADSTTSK